MKYDGIQGTLRYITPGLYFLALALLIYFNDTEHKYFLDAQRVQGFVQNNSAILVVLLPFVGFVIGLFIEGMMVWVERGVYLTGISSPARKILHGTTRYYYLDDELRKRILKRTEINDNKNATIYYQRARQKVGDNTLVARYYEHAMMARHIFGAQLLASAYYLSLGGGWSVLHLVLCLIFLGFIGAYTYHLLCEYMGFLFAESAKQLDRNSN